MSPIADPVLVVHPGPPARPLHGLECALPHPGPGLADPPAPRVSRGARVRGPAGHPRGRAAPSVGGRRHDLPGGRPQPRRSTRALQAGRVSPRVLARRAPAARDHRRRSRVVAARSRPAAPGPAHDHLSPGGPAAGRRRRQGRGSRGMAVDVRRVVASALPAHQQPAERPRGPARTPDARGGLSYPGPHVRCILSLRWPLAPRRPSSSSTARISTSSGPGSRPCTAGRRAREVNEAVERHAVSRGALGRLPAVEPRGPARGLDPGGGRRGLRARS